VIHAQKSTSVRLAGVTAGYGSVKVLEKFSLQAAPGELLAVLGPSGCGKTTVLKLIAGLLDPYGGEVEFDGVSINRVPAEKRGAAMVFQKPLLFPHLSVAENVGFSLKMKGTGETQIRRRVEEALAEVRLDGYGSRKPSQLSGGQEQRVALARALVSDPKVLLLDEPFSSLDENLRSEMRALLRRIQRRLGVTTVFVTHDQGEAAEIAHRIAFLRNGRLEQMGAPKEFFTAPATIEAARFFGWQVIHRDRSDQVLVFRPDAAELAACGQNEEPAGHLVLNGVLESCTDLGQQIRSTVRLDSGEIIEVHHGPPVIAERDRVSVRVSTACVRVIRCTDSRSEPQP
jgi:ABC-type Fe3+/spermidine/putrescine transport system ATPase subunit